MNNELTNISETPKKSIRLSKKDILYLAIIGALVVAVAVSLFFLMRDRNRGDDISYYDQKCNMFALENANLAHGQIVFIGDSITDGCALDNYYSALPCATYNRGIGGDTTAGVLARLKTSLFDVKPAKIVLMIGINDINGGVETATILDHYNEILTQIKKELPNTQVFCVSILPVNNVLESYTLVNVAKTTERILEINPEIEKLAVKHGYEFVNLFDEFADEGQRLYQELSPDGIHLNDAGYQKYSTLLIPHLKDTE